jgi:hypothetical protein
MTTIKAGIVPRQTNDINILPQIGFTGEGAAEFWISQARASEIFVKTPSLLSGATSSLGQSFIYLMNENLLKITGDPVISCFGSDFLIDKNNNILPSWRKASNSLNFDSPSISGNSGDRFEVFYIDFNKQSFLTDLLGNTAEAMVGLTYAHEIRSGSGTLTAKQIFYRKIGNVNIPEPEEEE